MYAGFPIDMYDMQKQNSKTGQQRFDVLPIVVVQQCLPGQDIYKKYVD